MVTLKCPECGETEKINQYRSPSGAIWCMTCGFRVEHKELENPFVPEKPYLEIRRITIELKYNPKYGDNRICKCGHPYHRHFDSYDDMDNVGCKYCNLGECDGFEEGDNFEQLNTSTS